MWLGLETIRFAFRMELVILVALIVPCVQEAIMAIPYTGLFFAASCNSRSSHGQYTRSSTENFRYGAVTSARLLGQNYRNRNFSKVRG